MDLVALRYAVRLNRMTRWRSPSSTCSAASTRCGSRSATARRRARSSTASPTTSRSCTRPTPEYEELPGFDVDIDGCRSEADLPPEARDYLDYIAEFVGVPIRLVGVGPDREQVVWLGD